MVITGITHVFVHFVQSHIDSVKLETLFFAVLFNTFKEIILIAIHDLFLLCPKAMPFFYNPYVILILTVASI